MLHQIRALDLSNNRLTGDLSVCWCNFQLLGLIDLSKNLLTGKLPNCWWNLQALQFMDLAKAGNNCSLESLYLAKNDFSGVLPEVLRGCNSLVTLDMGSNRFFGALPPWIPSSVPSLRILSLSSNNFTGEIPLELSWLSQLQLLDMANNSFTGSIPIAFSNLTTMRNPTNIMTPRPLDGSKYQDRVDVMWKGQELRFQRTLMLLTGIDLSGNLLSRCIPEELTEVQGLRFLNLLNFLESLDLSSNALTGSIPSSISSLLTLSMLNVSNNLLSGKIPVGCQIQTFTDPLIYSNNSGLCGFPLEVLCANTSLAPDERNNEEVDHWTYYFVIAGIVSGFWLWFGVLFTVKTWRCGFLSFVDGMQCKFTKQVPK
ncbi:hypothetical protein VPH35_108148 [Triticum aestivum]